jgi:hypothetical protein
VISVVLTTTFTTHPYAAGVSYIHMIKHEPTHAFPQYFILDQLPYSQLTESVYLSLSSELTSSASNQKQICPIQLQSVLVPLDLPNGIF